MRARRGERERERASERERERESEKVHKTKQVSDEFKNEGGRTPRVGPRRAPCALFDLERALEHDGLAVALAEDEQVLGVAELGRDGLALVAQPQRHAERYREPLERLDVF